MQTGDLIPQPVIQIGGLQAEVAFAGLVSPGEFQFNVVVVPKGIVAGDQPLSATYLGFSNQGHPLINIRP